MEGKKDMIEKLRREINSLQGYKAASDQQLPDIGLNAIMQHFPGGAFPLGTIHEFINTYEESAGATGAFISGILSALMGKGGAAIWISTARTLFPLAIARFGIEPHQIVFIDVQSGKQALWVLEEALKHEQFAGVVAELSDLSFDQSRRLQLACEKSKVTGFLIRTDPKRIFTTAAAARWIITHLPSQARRNKPGVAAPRWNVELQRVKNGNPGSWKVEWQVDHFTVIPDKQQEIINYNESRNVG